MKTIKAFFQTAWQTVVTSEYKYWILAFAILIGGFLLFEFIHKMVASVSTTEGFHFGTIWKPWKKIVYYAKGGKVREFITGELWKGGKKTAKWLFRAFVILLIIYAVFSLVFHNDDAADIISSMAEVPVGIIGAIWKPAILVLILIIVSKFNLFAGIWVIVYLMIAVKNHWFINWIPEYWDVLFFLSDYFKYYTMFLAVPLGIQIFDKLFYFCIWMGRSFIVIFNPNKKFKIFDPESRIQKLF